MTDSRGALTSPARWLKSRKRPRAQRRRRPPHPRRSAVHDPGRSSRQQLSRRGDSGGHRRSRPSPWHSSPIGTSVAIIQPWDTATPPVARTPATSAWPTTTVASTSSAPTSTGPPSPVTTTKTTTSVEPAQPYALPGCYRGGEDVSLTERPTESPFACRHHFFEGLTWMSWGVTGAEGTGIEQRQNCNPNCAQGEIFRNRVQVVFTGYELAPPDSGCPTTFRYYSQLIVAYPDLAEIPDGTFRSVHALCWHRHQVQRHACSPLQRPRDHLQLPPSVSSGVCGGVPPSRLWCPARPQAMRSSPGKASRSFGRAAAVFDLISSSTSGQLDRDTADHHRPRGRPPAYPSAARRAGRPSSSWRIEPPSPPATWSIEEYAIGDLVSVRPYRGSFEPVGLAHPR